MQLTASEHIMRSSFSLFMVKVYSREHFVTPMLILLPMVNVAETLAWQ